MVALREFVLFYFLLVGTTVSQSTDISDAKSSADTRTSNYNNDKEQKSDSVIEENPSYIDPKKRDDDEDDSDFEEVMNFDGDNGWDDDSDEEDSDDEFEEIENNSTTQRAKAKARISKAMQMLPQNTTSVKKIGRAGKVALKLLRKHQGELVLVAFVFAFRKELFYFLKKVFVTPREGGSVIKWNASNVIKLILLLDILRRLHQSSTLSSNPNSSDESQSNPKGRGSSSLIPTLALILLRSQMNPLLAMLLLPLFLSSSSKSSIYLPSVEQHYTFETINNRYQKDGMALGLAMTQALGGPPSQFTTTGGQSMSKESSKDGGNVGLVGLLSSVKEKSLPPSPTVTPIAQQNRKYSSTTILLDMTQLDMSVSQMDTIRDKVSFILTECNTMLQQQMEVEVCVVLESPGGSAADYALAAQQIMRLRNHPNITVTVVVDKVAASGGYMIACTSSPGHLFAAPFAVLGSIGVVGQTVNVQKTLEGLGVQPLVFRGGRHKAPVGLVGEITEEGLSTVQSMIDMTHRAFKRHVAESRPIIRNNIDEIATGETWLGYDALEKGLIDRIVTSDEYISERMAQGSLVLKILRIKRHQSTLFRPPTEGTDFGTAAPRYLSFFRMRRFSQLLNRANRWIQRSGAFSPSKMSISTVN